MNRLTRRALLYRAAGLGLAAAGAPLLACRDRATPAPPRVRRIGYLNRLDIGPNYRVLRQRLNELGWVENETLAVELGTAAGDPLRLPELAAGLVQRGVELIVAPTAVDVQAARDAAPSLPIVMALSGDPIGLGLIDSYARPGGMITGLTRLSPELGVKRLELLKEIVPATSRVAVMRDANDPETALELREVQQAAGPLGLSMHTLEVRTEDELRAVFEQPELQAVDAMVILGGAFVVGCICTIVDLSRRRRLPVVLESTFQVEGGGLISYGANQSALFSRAAAYVDRILRGARPADLPVERPTTFDLTVNLKSAAAIGVTIPSSVLARATKVIE